MHGRLLAPLGLGGVPVLAELELRAGVYRQSGDQLILAPRAKGANTREHKRQSAQPEAQRHVEGCCSKR